MNKDEAVARGEAAMDRDPRQAPMGYFAGGSFVLDGVRVFSWFESMDKLAEHLMEAEPAIYDVGDPADLTAWKERVAPILEALKAEGFNDALKEQLNKAAVDFMKIEWWGSFDELVKGRTGFARSLVSSFSDADIEDDVQPVESEDLNDYIDFLKTCGV